MQNSKRPFLIFVIGRPGSGKSTLINLVREIILEIKGTELNTLSIPDYDYFAEIFRNTNYEGKKYITCPKGGYLIIDGSVFNEALYDLCNRIQTSTPKVDIIFCEFARSNYCEAFQLLATSECKPDLIVYIGASFKTCLRRNEVRRVTKSDSHYVSREEMLETFVSDDLEAVRLQNNYPLIEFRNEVDGMTNAKTIAENIAHAIISYWKLHTLRNDS